MRCSAHAPSARSASTRASTARRAASAASPRRSRRPTLSAPPASSSRRRSWKGALSRATTSPSCPEKHFQHVPRQHYDMIFLNVCLTGTSISGSGSAEKRLAPTVKPNPGKIATKQSHDRSEGHPSPSRVGTGHHVHNQHPAKALQWGMAKYATPRTGRSTSTAASISSGHFAPCTLHTASVTVQACRAPRSAVRRTWTATTSSRT